MIGKSKCKILKQIRTQIARENDIEFVTSECKYQGECSGTCPKCEAEVRYLEQELQKRQAAGKKLVVAGLAAAMMLGAAACSAAGEQAPPAQTTQAPSEKETTEAAPETEETNEATEATEITEPSGELMGEPPVWPTDDELQLMGDLPLIDPTETEPEGLEGLVGSDTGDFGPLH